MNNLRPRRIDDNSRFKKSWRGGYRPSGKYGNYSPTITFSLSEVTLRQVAKNAKLLDWSVSKLCREALKVYLNAYLTDEAGCLDQFLAIKAKAWNCSKQEAGLLLAHALRKAKLK